MIKHDISHTWIIHSEQDWLTLPSSSSTNSTDIVGKMFNKIKENFFIVVSQRFSCTRWTINFIPFYPINFPIMRSTVTMNLRMKKLLYDLETCLLIIGWNRQTVESVLLFGSKILDLWFVCCSCCVVENLVVQRSNFGHDNSSSFITLQNSNSILSRISSKRITIFWILQSVNI